MPFSPHFPAQSSQGNINPDKKDVKENKKSHLVGENASPAAERPEKAKNQPDVCLVKKKIIKKIIVWGLGIQEELQRDDVRQRRSLGHEGQFEVVDDPVHHSLVGDEGDDAHLAISFKIILLTLSKKIIF